MLVIYRSRSGLEVEDDALLIRNVRPPKLDLVSRLTFLGVGYYGECDHYSFTNLVREDMISIEDVDVRKVHDTHIERWKRVE